MNSVMNNELNMIKEKTFLETNTLINEISKYNTIDFLMSVSALMLFPQNQSKAIIFQTMINAVLTLPVEKTNLQNKMSITTFKKIVRGFEKSSVSLMVDPPEFPFILPVLYFENPYVFMGNNSLSPVYLGNALKILEINKNKIEYNKYIRLTKIINGLLQLSNNIVNALKIKIEDLKFYSVEEEIYIPDKTTLENYKKLLLISSEKFKDIFEDNINDYTMNFESIKIEEILCVGDPKFLFKPFVKYNNVYIILDITAILPLVFRIIIKETYYLSNVNFIEEYNKLNSLEMNKRFIMLGCKEIIYPEIKLIIEKDYEERLFLIGNDSVVISVQLFDKGDDFDFNKESNDVEFKRNLKFISKRISYLSKFLVSNDVNRGKIFVVVTPYTLGRNFIYSLMDCDMRNILILSLYELDAVAINEEKNKYFIQEYIAARKKLKYYEKNLFSELNIVALFTNSDYSFYSGDELDSKDAFFLIRGDYSSNYILKSYIKESKRLCNFYKSGKFIEVIKIDKSIYFAPQLFFEQELNKVVIDNNSTIWIICNMKSKDDYNLFQWLSDLVGYWFSELLPLKEDNYNLIIELNINEKLSFGIKQMEITNDISNILSFDLIDNKLKIEVTEQLCNYFNCETNAKEKAFIEYLIKILKNKFDFTIDEKKIEKIFENPYKRKTNNIDSISGSYMIPSNNSDFSNVSKAFENMILDEIGLYFKNEKKVEYGIIKDYKIINLIVDYLYKKLSYDLKKYNKHDLICYLYEMYDNNLATLLIRQNFYVNDITCYPEHKREIENNINEMTKLSVALKFLIELVSSYVNYGEKAVSHYDLNYNIAIAAQIIEWAYTGDLLHYEMIDSDISLLNSNRIGFDKTSAYRINYLLKNAMFSKSSVEGLENLKKVDAYFPKAEKENDCFDEAFYDEFGYSFDDYNEVTITMLEMFNENYDELLEITSNDVEANVQRKISNNVIEKIMDSLSLKERADFLKPPEPYKNTDVYPWRFNRALSFNRKPLIKFNNGYIVGYRTLINSVHFLFSIINDGRYHAVSEKMNKYVSRNNNIKGKLFNDHVYNYISSFGSLIVTKNVKKINKKIIADDNNNILGDIDILYISKRKKVIGIIETKNFSIAKNYYEINNEYKEMFDPDNPKSFYKKHKKRVDWIHHHLEDVIYEYNLSNGKWKIRDMFIVDDIIISKKAFRVQVNIYTLRDLEEKDLY